MDVNDERTNNHSRMGTRAANARVSAYSGALCPQGARGGRRVGQLILVKTAHPRGLDGQAEAPFTHTTARVTSVNKALATSYKNNCCTSPPTTFSRPSKTEDE